MENANYSVDNIIGWLFDKIFNQLTMNGKELYNCAFDTICKKTFENSDIHKLISKLSGRTNESVSDYLSNKYFQEDFLFDKLKKKIPVQILLNNLSKIKSLINDNYRIDKECLQFAIINNRFQIVEYIVNTCSYVKPDNQLLIYCVEYGYEDIYFYLRDIGLSPNITIYNRAVNGCSLAIITDINKYIGISDKILTRAFEINNTSILFFLLSVAYNDKIKINKNLVAYPILNNNMELLRHMEENKLFDWHCELYYSALLSGSMEMIKMVENRIPNIHDDRFLDTSKIKKGQMSHILNDIIYVINDKKYFSHTINYAIQSKSLDVVKYVYTKGYGITVSNFVTAIKQGTIQILDFLCKQYQGVLPFYLIHYFGMNSFIDDKFLKISLLLNSNLLSLNHDNLSINDYKTESVHLQLINQCTEINEFQCHDPDFLMKYNMLFLEKKGMKINHRLITKTRICLELNKEKELLDIFNVKYNDVNKQYIVDVLFLFGTITQIKKLYQLQQPLIVPSSQIIMEIICYSQINKLCFLVQNNLLTKSIISIVYPLVNILADQYLSNFFGKICDNKPSIKHILLSRNKPLILEWFKTNNVEQSDINKKNLKNVLKLESICIAQKIEFPTNYLSELIDWTLDNDLLTMHDYLNSLKQNKN